MSDLQFCRFGTNTEIWHLDFLKDWPVNPSSKQNLSDICNITISKSYEKEATSLGAAIVSGIGSRNIKDLVEFESILSKSETFRPKMENKLRDKIISNWNSAIKQTVGMSFE